MCVEIAKFVNATEHPMFLPACEGAVTVFKATSTALEHVWSTINWLDHQVDGFAGPYASPGVINVARTFIRAAPYTAIPLLLPKYLSIGVYGGLYVHRIIVGSVSGSSTLIDISNGVAFSSLIFGAHDIKCGIQQGSVCKTVRGLGEIALFAYMWSVRL